MLLNELHALEAEWQRHSAPIAGALRKGLTEGQLDDVADHLGVTLPLELRQLWAWHDGTDAEPGYNGAEIGPGYFVFHSTEAVIWHHRQNLEAHKVSPEPDLLPEWYWHKSWVPFMTRDADRLYIDCDRRTSDSRSAPVREVAWDWIGFDSDLAPSLTHAVSMWVWLLRENYIVWNPSSGQWGSEKRIPLFAIWNDI